MSLEAAEHECQCKRAEAPQQREVGVLAVVALTFAMMVIEIAVGYRSHSLALLADGWHMATHVGALSITALAYGLARRFATHRAFTFGTGKVHALGGFASAVLLGIVALSMMVEAVTRLLAPHAIDFGQSLPVAVIGLVVNLLSIALLHHHDDDDSEAHATHDHGHRAAVLHVVADAFTSALAIVALLIGKHFGITWLDAATGMLGGIVILKWCFELLRVTGSELLDLNAGENLEDRVRAALNELPDLHVIDLHVWSMGRGRMSCMATIESGTVRSLDVYRDQILRAVPLVHLTIEVRQRTRE